MTTGRPPKVILLYRKPWHSRNFSIEISFDQMLASFPAERGWVVEKVVCPFYSKGILSRLRALRAVGRLQADVYHITGDVHFLALALPRRRTVLTVHDCGFLYDRPRLRGWLLRSFWLDWPVRRCRAITAVSEATRQDILRNSSCEPSKVRVIPTVIAEHFQRAAPRPLSERPCVLHVGLAPNKNFLRHVEALAGVPCRLRVVGKLEPMHHEWLRRHQVEYTHGFNLSAAEMQEAYGEADLLLFASTFEGFGMPVLEAQTVGRPVVTSNASSLPEVAGDGACLVDPFDVASIRAGVVQVIEDAAYRAALVQRGFENVKRFRPRTVASQYADLYAEVLGGNGAAAGGESERRERVG